MNYRELEKIFEGKEDLLNSLVALEEKREKIKEKIYYLENGKPIVITLLGSPRTGKTTVTNNFYDFMKKSGLKVIFCEEPANAVYKTFLTDEEKKKAISNKYSFNLQLRNFAFNQVREGQKKNCNVILCDRGYLDPYIWLRECVTLNEISQKKFDDEISVLKNFNSDYESIVVALESAPQESIKRDYLCSLSLDDRKYITKPNLEKYNHSMQYLEPYFMVSNKCFIKVDTNNNEIMDTALYVANQVCDKLIEIATLRKEAEETKTKTSQKNDYKLFNSYMLEEVKSGEKNE